MNLPRVVLRSFLSTKSNNGSMPEEQAPIKLMEPVGAIVVTVTFLIC